jgi:hypothetical protein
VIYNVKQNGLVYVGFGYEHLLMAAHSAFTAKKHNPELICTVITNIKLNETNLLADYFDFVHEESLDSEHNRDVKIRAIDYATFEKGAYLDCDTEVQGDLGPLFRCLDRFEIILKLNARPTNKNYRIDEGLSGNEFPFWNGGMVFFKNGPSASRFFREWLRIFYEIGKRSDQPALARTVYENPDIRYLSVNCMWNTFPDDVSLLKTKGYTTPSRIWHYRDPRDFPDVAARIFQHHSVVSAAVYQDTDKIRAEIQAIEKKYRFLCSWFYRCDVTRKCLFLALRVFWRFGFLRDYHFGRTRYREGGQFEVMQ